MLQLKDRLYMASNGIVKPIGPETNEAWTKLESLVRDEYDCLHTADSFEDLKLRARFSKEDQGLLRDWMAIAARRSGNGGLT